MEDQIYKSVLDSLDAYIVLIDESGRIVYTNRAWGKLVAQLGAASDVVWLDKSYLDCCSILQVDSVDYCAKYQREFAEILQGSKDSFTIECADYTIESKIWLQVSASVLISGDQRYFLLNHVNIHDKKNSAQVIKKLTLKDPDTGLANAKGFLSFYKNEWQRSMRSRSEVALLVGEFDAENLDDKQRNLLADVFARHARRACDLACRVKDNQFLLVLGQVNSLSCDVIATAIHQEIASLHLLSRDGLDVNIKIGFSSATPTLIDHPEMLINAVALALAKSQDSSKATINSYCPTIIFKQKELA